MNSQKCENFFLNKKKSIEKKYLEKKEIMARAALFHRDANNDTSPSLPSLKNRE